MNSPVLLQLNKVLKDNLAAISQYFLHARLLKHMQLVEMADYEYKESIQHMKHADILVERILSIGGIPNMQELSAINVGECLESILQYDWELEQTICKSLQDAVFVCDNENDHVSSDMIVKMLENGKEHIRFIQDRIMNQPEKCVDSVVT